MVGFHGFSRQSSTGNRGMITIQPLFTYLGQSFRIVAEIYFSRKDASRPHIQMSLVRAGTDGLHATAEHRDCFKKGRLLAK